VPTAVSILRGLKPRYEAHHGVSITDAAVVLAAKLAKRYIPGRRLPDSAIDLIDESCANIRVQLDSQPEVIDRLERRLLQLEVEAEALKVRGRSGSGACGIRGGSGVHGRGDAAVQPHCGDDPRGYATDSISAVPCDAAAHCRSSRSATLRARRGWRRRARTSPMCRYVRYGPRSCLDSGWAMVSEQRLLQIPTFFANLCIRPPPAGTCRSS
jgi:ATP-dependent Clp protease ATP-binding subunit ClpA